MFSTRETISYKFLYDKAKKNHVKKNHYKLNNLNFLDENK